MTQKFANVARSRLVGALAIGATSLTIESATADLFPVANTPDWLSLNDWFKAVLQDDLGNIEIIYVGVRNSGSGVFSNVQRGKEGTAQRNWSAGAVVGLRLTALDHEGLVNIKTADNTFSGVNTFSQPIVGDLDGNAATATNADAAAVSALANAVADDVVSSPKLTADSVTTAKIVDRAVTAAKMMAATTARLWGRITAGAGDVEELTGEQAQSVLPVQQPRVDVASAATVVVPTGTDHLNITGTTPITGFTIAAGRLIFARFAASLTLTNGAGLVTQSGANIVVQAGDFCILRATAANVVEVLCHVPTIPLGLGQGQTWQNMTGSRAVGVNYTNNTPRPIFIAVRLPYSPNVDVTLYVGGVYVAQASNVVGYYTNRFVYTVVPPGSTYSAGGTMDYWAELR